MKQFKSVLAASALLVSAFGGSSLQAVCVANQLVVGGSTSTTGPADGKELRIADGDDGTFLVSGDVGGPPAFSTKWSPSGDVIAVGDATSVRVFDTSFTELASASHGSSVRGVDWSPDENFIAMGGSTPGDGFQVRVFSWDGASTLTELAGSNFIHDATVRSVAWSPDGKFLAVAGDDAADTFSLRILEFDGLSLSTTTGGPADFFHGAGVDICSVDWHPDGDKLGIGGRAGTGDFEVRAVSFDGSTIDATPIASFNHVVGSTVEVNSVAWHPTGNFLAIGSVINASGPEVRVLEFDESAGTLIDIGENFEHGTTVFQVAWYPGGGRLAMAGSGTGNNLRVFAFDPNDSELEQLFTKDHGANLNSVDVLACPAKKGGCDCEIDDCLVTSFRGNFAVDPCRKLLANFIDPVRLNGTTGKFEQDDDTESITCFSGNVGVGECRTLLTNRICPVVDIEISDKCTVCDAGDRGCEENQAGCLELCGDQVIIAGKLLVNDFGPFDEGCLTKDGVRSAPAPMRFAGDVDIVGNVLTGGVNLSELIADTQIELAQLKALIKN